jgi:hypothetical protein
METKWAIVNNQMIVVALWEGSLDDFDFSSVENYNGEVKYSEPFEYRGNPTLGSYWDVELDKFI